MAMLACSGSSAEGRLWLAGAETSPGNHYLYAGVLLPAFGGNLGEGLVQRYWLDRQTYRYDSDDRTIEAEAYGAEAALGYARPTDRGNLVAYLGLLYRDTELTPRDPTNRASGGNVRVKAQLESNARLSSGRELGLMGSYIFGQKGYWGRARLGQALANGLQTGPEFLVQGDPEYRIAQAGWFLSGLALGPRTELGLKAGVRMQQGEGRSGYLGLELTGLF
jgi:hypothetical protein